MRRLFYKRTGFTSGKMSAGAVAMALYMLSKRLFVILFNFISYSAY